MKFVNVKSVFLFLITAAMLFMLMSCYSEEKNNTVDANTNQEIVIDETAEPVNEDLDNIFIMNEGSQLYPFFNGYAVIRNNKSGNFAIIDTSGNIVMTYDEHPNVFPYHLIFPDELLIYADATGGMENSTFCIMDLKGNVLFEFAEHNINFERVNLDNYTIEVNQLAGEQNSNRRQYGVLDTDGNWIMEITDGYKSMYGVSKNVVLCVVDTGIQIGTYDSALLINTDTGKTLELTQGVMGSVSNTLHSRPYENNGKTIMITTIENQSGIYALNEDLSYELIMYHDAPASSDGVGILSGGVFYVDSEKAFFDLGGQKMMDIPQETVNFYQSEYTKYPYIKDNLLQKVFKDTDGTTKYTLVDINDNHMYEPNKLRFTGEIYEGLVPVKGDDYVGYIDTSGNRVLDLTQGFTEVSAFKNGIAIGYSTQYDCNVYIDLNGNILFMDKIQYK